MSDRLGPSRSGPYPRTPFEDRRFTRSDTPELARVVPRLPKLSTTSCSLRDLFFDVTLGRRVTPQSRNDGSLDVAGLHISYATREPS